MHRFLSISLSYLFLESSLKKFRWYYAKSVSEQGAQRRVLMSILDRAISLEFTNEEGKEVSLNSVFGDDKPVFFMLNYYSCVTLCSAQLNGIVKGLRDRLEGRKIFALLWVLIRKRPQNSPKKRRAYLESLGDLDAEWHFWVGKEMSITALAVLLV